LFTKYSEESAMSLSSASAVSSEPTEAVLGVFRDAGHPLTLPQARKLYTGPSLTAKNLQSIVEEQTLQGRLFQCSPSGKSPRYWVQDEEQRVREEIEAQLQAQPLSESKLATQVAGALKGVTTKAAVQRSIQALRAGGRLHLHPGRGTTCLLALHPFNPFEAVTFTKGTLKELTGILSRLERVGVTLDQLLAVLSLRLRPPAPVAPEPAPSAAAVTGAGEPAPAGPPAGAAPPVGEQGELEQLILKGMRDLEPNVDGGAPVSLGDLRRHMPLEYRGHDTFDAAVLRLAEQDRVVLHWQTQPADLTEAERADLVRDGKGTLYTLIAHRV
jgi:hypothetical protein